MSLIVVQVKAFKTLPMSKDDEAKIKSAKQLIELGLPPPKLEEDENLPAPKVEESWVEFNMNTKYLTGDNTTIPPALGASHLGEFIHIHFVTYPTMLVKYTKSQFEQILHYIGL